MALEYIALIPAYEPDEKMSRVISDLKYEGFSIIVVDDGSGDGFERIFAEAAEYATVLTHPANRGKGAAIRTGLSYIYRYRIAGCADANDIVVVTVDADGQHLAKDARRVAITAGSRPGTLVLGSRDMRKCVNVPIRSRLGNGVTRCVYKMVTGVGVHDTQTGLRAFTADVIPKLLEVNGDRYEYEINMLLEFAREGDPIIEEGIETVYIDENQTSHFDSVRDSWRVYREILKFSASSFISFLIDYGIYALLLVLTSGIGGNSTTGLAAFIGTNSLLFSNIGARLVSASANYTINRRLVFRSKAGVAKSALKYVVLAAFILAGNTAVLSTFVGTLGINALAAKILTEILFFMMSWLVQRYVIFYRDEVKAPSKVRVSSSVPPRLDHLQARRGAHLKCAYTSSRTAAIDNGGENS